MPRTTQFIRFVRVLSGLGLALVVAADTRANDYVNGSAPRPLPQHAARPIEASNSSWPQAQPAVATDNQRRLPERFASAQVAAPAPAADEGPRPLTAPAGRRITQERNQ